MTDDQLHAMQGQIEALNLAITALMLNLPATSAERAATNLQLALCDEQQQDAVRSTHPSQAAARDATASVYGRLLAVVAQTAR